MKATKKIVGAACALVAAVALSAGSTFAWFANNNQVTATGMHIIAAAPTNIFIEKGYIASADGVNKETVAIGKSIEAMSPSAISTSAIVPGADGAADTIDTADGATTALNIVNATSYVENKKPGADYSGDVTKYGLLGTLTPGMDGTPGTTWAGETIKDSVKQYAQDDYVLVADMTVANKAAKTNLDAVVTISWKATVTTQIYKFMRVGFLVGTPTVGETETTWSYEFVSLANDISTTGGNITSGTDYVYDGDARSVTIEFSDLVEDFDQNTVRTFTFLAWLDGDDAECYINNIVSVSEIDLEVAFTASEPALTPDP